MWTALKPMIAPRASGPGMRTPGDQYGWSIRPSEPAGTVRASSSKSTSGAIPRSAASATSRSPNSRLNHSTIQ